MLSRLKREDDVLVIRGKDKGKKGKIQRIIPSKNMVLVEGVNIAKKHLRAGAQGARQAGIVSMEVPLDASKVMPICPSCDKPTRIRVQVLDDGTKSRICKRCNGMMS